MFKFSKSTFTGARLRHSYILSSTKPTQAPVHQHQSPWYFCRPFHLNLHGNDDPPGTCTVYQQFGPKPIYDVACFHRHDKQPMPQQDATHPDDAGNDNDTVIHGNYTTQDEDDNDTYGNYDDDE